MSNLRKFRILGIALIVALIATVVVASGIFTASAQEYTDGDYTYTVVDGGATVTGYVGDEYIITIPETLGGYPVTTIGESAFESSDLWEVTMPSVKYVSANAFLHSSIAYVYMPNVLTVGDFAFYDCFSLMEAYMPKVEEIGEEAFNFYSTDFTIIAPFGSYAYDYAAEQEKRYRASDCYEENGFQYAVVNNEAIITGYSGWMGYEYIEVPVAIGGYAVTAIGDYAFYGITEDIYAPLTLVETVHRYAFYGCTSITPSDLSHIKTIGDYAFAESGVCTLNLDSVTTIGAYAFYGCEYLTSVQLPNVKSIGDSAFENCSWLRAVFLRVVEEIGAFAFENCDFNMTVYAPVDSYAYEYCSNAYEYCSNVCPADIYEDGIAYTLSNGEATITRYDDFLVVGPIPETISGFPVTTIGTNAFLGSNPGEINTAGVKCICANAFSGCIVREIYMPNVEYVDAAAFDYCSGLTDVIVDEDNAYYSTVDGVLYNKDKTELIHFPMAKEVISFTVPESVTIIGAYAFRSQGYLTSVTMPNVTTIGNYGFADVYYLDSVEMPKVTTIGESAFNGCCCLTSAIIPNAVTIDDYAFLGVELTELSAPKVTTIGEDAFSYCEFTNLSLPNVISIGSGNFYHCTALVTVDLPNVTTIGSSNFRNCSSLASVTMPNVASIGSYSFYACNKGLTIFGYLDSYAQEYAVNNRISFAALVISPVSYEIVDGKIIFTVITPAGDYNRLKLTTADNLGGSLVTANSYTVNANGDYVWTIKFTAPEETTTYAFDLRSSVTNKYVKEYLECEVEIIPIFKSVSHEIVDDKIIFTVVTSAGDYNRLKLTTADNLSGSLVTANSYIVDENGDYVWTIKFTEPVETTQYAFDMRSSETGKYIKDYFIYEAEIIPTFKSISHEIVDGKLVITVVTVAGDYNRIKLTTVDDLKGSLATVSSYTVNEDGDYVWTIKFTVPEETTNYAFDLRSSETGKYVKDYGYYECVIEKTIKSVVCEENEDKLVFTVVTKAGEYNRLRCGLSESITDNIINANTYTVNADGDYVWTLKITKPTENTTLYFDLRDTATNKFVKEFYIFDYVI